jgi:hypothetical protein
MEPRLIMLVSLSIHTVGFSKLSSILGRKEDRKGSKAHRTWTCGALHDVG